MWDDELQMYLVEQRLTKLYIHQHIGDHLSTVTIDMVLYFI